MGPRVIGLNKRVKVFFPPFSLPSTHINRHTWDAALAPIVAPYFPRPQLVQAELDMLPSLALCLPLLQIAHCVSSVAAAFVPYFPLPQKAHWPALPKPSLSPYFPCPQLTHVLSGFGKKRPRQWHGKFTNGQIVSVGMWETKSGEQEETRSTSGSAFSL